MSALQSRLDLGGHPVWSPTDASLGVAFVGRSTVDPAAVYRDAEQARREIMAVTVGVDRPVAWLRQVHGADALEARAGCVGDGDALTTTRRDIALAISTADCVPIVLVAANRVTAVHAGWRGIVAGVVARAVESFDPAAEAPTGWIGPAIGACCYEVGPDVAHTVVAACGDSGVLQASADSSRPHLDLARAVEAQLRRCGVEPVSTVHACTYCTPQLHSFRRDGAAAGRNLAFAWLAS